MTVENISIDVKTNADRAANKLNSLSVALGKVSSAASGLSNGNMTALANAVTSLSQSHVSVAIFNSLATGITRLGEALKTVTPEDANVLDKIATSLAKLQGVDLKGFGSAIGAARRVSAAQAEQTPISAELQGFIESATQIDVLEAKLVSLRIAMQDAFDAGNIDKAYSIRGQIIQVEAAIDKAANGANRAKHSLRSVGDAAKKATSGVKGLFASLKRIAMYRLLRTVLKAISQAFKEGLTNAYFFSRTINGTLAKSLDSLSTKALTMKNQLGAALGGLLESITPLLLKLIDLATKAAQALSAFFAAISGGQYLVANEVAQSWDKATGAANKYKNTVLGFDELNRLDDSSGYGAGVSDMFVVGVLPPWAQRIKDFLDSDLAAKLKLNFKDILLNWGKKLTGKQIAKKVITGLAALCGATAGFLIGGVPGAIVGTLIGASLGVLFSSFLFDNDGVLSKEEVLKLVCTAAGALAGGALGFVVGGVAGAAIGVLVGAGLGVTISTMIFGEDGEQKDKVLKTLIVAMSALAGGVIGFMVGGPLGAVIGATVGAGVSLEIVNAAFAGAGDRKEMLTRTVVSVLLALAGGAIGFAVGGPLGALIGVTIGAGVSLVINNAAFADNGKSMQENILKSLIVVLGALVGGAIGFAIGGPLGAVIGAAIGIGVTLVATSIAWDQGSAEAIKNAGTKVNVSGSSHSSGKFASGGFPDTGSLFIAREAGPELVGTINGNTAVANNDQIVEAVASGVASAVSAVLGSSRGGDTSVHVYLDSREIKAGQTRLSRAMGV